jgi:ADP-ribosyl-[dinitrogen reductase] hydrolase
MNDQEPTTDATGMAGIDSGFPIRIPLPAAPATLDAIAMQRLVGAFLGSAVGDALGAPFEFGPAGAYSARFPEPVIGGTGELIGGGPFIWAAGEFTDDTQMAIALGESIVACNGFDADDVWARFQAWRRGAKDCGSLTNRALSNPSWPGAAEDAHRAFRGRSGANGSLMRVTGLACAYAAGDEATLIDAARAQSALTHFDPAAGWGAAIAAALIRRSILGEDALAAIPDLLGLIDEPDRERFTEMLDPSWSPHDPSEVSNGSVWGCLAQAVWAVRAETTFAGAVTAAIDLGGDTDTVAAVAGALAGARSSVQGIPSRWLTYLNGVVGAGADNDHYDNAALQDLARRLAGRTPVPATITESPAGPTEVAPGLHAADLGGAATVPADWAIVSMCRTHGRFDGHAVRREVHLIDQAGAANADPRSAVRDAVDSIDAFLAEGRTVVVHCHGGRSRTGLVLKAWAMRSNGWDEREAHAWLEKKWSRYEDYQTSFVDLLSQNWP